MTESAIKRTAVEFLKSMTDQQLQQAQEFYNRSPDGQWDEVAAACIAFVRAQRALDNKHGIRW